MALKVRSKISYCIQCVMRTEAVDVLKVEVSRPGYVVKVEEMVALLTDSLKLGDLDKADLVPMSGISILSLFNLRKLDESHSFISRR